jgi:tRNA(fMet)-specific endonuclease VapC
MYALGTNTVLDYFRGRGNVATNLLAVPAGEIALPAIVAYEVWFGVLGS